VAAVNYQTCLVCISAAAHGQPGWSEGTDLFITVGGDQQMWEVTVDKEKCTGDEECVDVCPVDVFEMVDGKADPVNADECLGCESCVEVCETDAITVEEV